MLPITRFAFRGIGQMISATIDTIISDTTTYCTEYIVRGILRRAKLTYATIALDTLTGFTCFILYA